MTSESKRLIARVAKQDPEKGFSWVVIDYDADSTLGYYLFFCGTGPEDVQEDHWFRTEVEAKAYAARTMGIWPTDWQAGALNGCAPA